MNARVLAKLFASRERVPARLIINVNNLFSRPFATRIIKFAPQLSATILEILC